MKVIYPASGALIRSTCIIRPRTVPGAMSLTTPTYNRHTIYGAMVGGPNSSDQFTDDRSQYQYTEPACDYNALLVGNLAKMYSLYGGTPLATFPVQDPIDQEFYVQAKINASGSNFTEIDAYMYNCSGFPARFASNLNLRYYMDLTELFNAGYTTSNLTFTTNYAKIRSPLLLINTAVIYIMYKSL